MLLFGRRVKTVLTVIFAGIVGLSVPLAASSRVEKDDVYRFVFASIDGQRIQLSDYKGKVILIVNTASRCGFTKQYAGLVELWNKYRAKGLIILGLPSNDFGGQEPGAESEIKNFCQMNFGVDFPMSSKIHVKGKKAHPFYRWAGEKLGLLAKPRWNFHKYLISSEGQIINWFSSFSSPTSKRLIKAVEEALEQRDKAFRQQ